MTKNITHALIGFDYVERKWYGLNEGTFEDMMKERKTSYHYNNADSDDNRGYAFNQFGYDEFKVVDMAEAKRYE